MNQQVVVLSSEYNLDDDINEFIKDHPEKRVVSISVIRASFLSQAYILVEDREKK